MMYYWLQLILFFIFVPLLYVYDINKLTSTLNCQVNTDYIRQALWYRKEQRKVHATLNTGF